MLSIIGKWLGHWLVYFILSAIVAWIVYAGLIRPVIKPNPTSVQSGGVSYNYTINLGMLSCARIPKPTDMPTKAVSKIAPVVAAVKTAVQK
jgi:hypothetical protein